MDNEIYLETTESSEVKPTGGGRLLVVLKYLGVAVFLIAALIVLFTFLPTEGGLFGKMLSSAGITENAKTAYAWTMPNGANCPSSVTGGGPKTLPVLTPGMSQPTTFSYAYDTTAVGNGSGSNGFDITLGSGKEYKGHEGYFVYYWDVKVDDNAREAIKNGQINSVTVKMQTNIQQDGINYAFEAWASFFILAGSDNGTGFDITPISTLSKASSEDKYGTTGSYNSTSSRELTLDLAKNPNITRIRCGIYVRIRKTSGTVTLKGDIKCHSMQLTEFTIDHVYKDNKFPKIIIDVGQGSTEQLGSVEVVNNNHYKIDDTAFVAGMKYSANFNGTSMSGAVTVGNVTAKPKKGCYFSGWSITGGTITSVTSYNNITFTITSGAYICPDGYNYGATNVVTIKANFRSLVDEKGIDLSQNTPTYSYTYKQDQTTFEGVRQGPRVVIPTICDAEGGSGTVYDLWSGTSDTVFTKNGANFYTGTMISGEPYTGGSQKPFNASQGSYTYRVGVFIQNAPNTTNCLGYYSVTFVIDRADVSVNDTMVCSSLNGEDPKTYTSEEIKPDVSWLIVQSGSQKYKLVKGTDYNIGDTNNITYSGNTYVTSEALAKITPPNTSNFRGAASAKFAIVPLEISTTTVDTEMANEIALNYNTIYNSFELRPQVILVRVKSQLNGATKTHTLYIGAANVYADNFSKYKDYNGVSYKAMPTVSESVTSFDIVAGSGAEATAQSRPYYNNVNVGRGYFYIQASGNLTGNIKVEFDILPLNLDLLATQYPGASISERYTQPYNAATMEYNGDYRKPLPAFAYVTISNLRHYVYRNNVYSITASEPITLFFRDSNAPERLGDVFAVPESYPEAGATTTHATFAGPVNSDSANPYSYNNNKDVARSADGKTILENATITIELSGGGNVIGGFFTLFKIEPKSIAPWNAAAPEEKGYGKIENIADQTYTGSSVTTTFKFSCKLGNEDIWTELNQNNNNDYDVVFSDNENVSRTAKITITGKNNYCGTYVANFKIGAMDLSGGVIEDSVASITYTGNKLEPSTSNITSINIKKGGIVYTLTSAAYTVQNDANPSSEFVYNTIVGGNNYVYITLKGKCAGDADWAVAGTDGSDVNYCASTHLKAYFTITPKDLANIDMTATKADWNKGTYKSKIIYNGLPIINLPIEANNDPTASTLYLYDEETGENRHVLRYGDENSSDIDYYVSGWGTNINAGDESGEIILTGKGNYTGTLTVNFAILPKSLSDFTGVDANASNSVTLSTEGYDATNSGYSFTGASITPAVTGIYYILRNADNAGVNLVAGRDYTVSYGANIYVTTGGTVKITGTGNYTDSFEVGFAIAPISQTITFDDPIANVDNADVIFPESIAVRSAGLTLASGKALYADYECRGDAAIIKLTAYTTAIYPTPRRITFRLATIDGAKIDITPSYSDPVLVEKDGATLAMTEATIALAKKYCVICIYAEQYDSGNAAVDPDKDSTDNRGNYRTTKYKEGDVTFRIFSKRIDKTATPSQATFLTSYEKTYGNSDFVVKPGLDSWTQKSYVYTITSNNPSVVSVFGSGASRTVRILNAGSAKLTISHNGHVGQYDEYAYLPFSTEINVTVNPRDLYISFTTRKTGYEYGTELVAANDFIITFETAATGDTITTLDYDNISDTLADIIGVGGAVVRYSEAHRDVGTHEIAVQQNMGVTPGPKVGNYNIHYGTGFLTISKKTATINIIQNDDEPNKIVRSYGENNPVNCSFEIEGLAYDYQTEYDDIVNAWTRQEYNRFIIEYKYIDESDHTEHTIDETSPCGSYTIHVTGATAKNYEFAVTDVTLTIDPALVTIDLEDLKVTYDGNPHEANAAIISGVTTPGCDGPSDGGTIRYRYEYTNGFQTTKPTNAGVYRVEVTYIPVEGDNYATTKLIFSTGLEILKALPEISYGGIKQVAYSKQLRLEDLTAIISATGNGTTPLSTEASYYFRKYNSGDEYTSHVVGSYIELEAGYYDVMVEYHANPNDNYRSGTKYIPAVVVRDEQSGKDKLVEGLEISASAAIIRVLKDLPAKTYDGNPILFNPYTIDPTERYFEVYYRDIDVNGDIIERPLDLNDVTFYFLTGNDTGISVDGIKGKVTTQNPTNAGTYIIQAVYEGSGGEASRTVTPLTENPIVIKPYDLKNNGIRFADSFYGIANEYNGLPHVIEAGQVECVPVQGGSDPAGTISVSYKKNGVMYEEPVNAGTYIVCVGYEPGINDNYTLSVSYVELTGQSIIINPAEVSINYDSSISHVYAFNGQERSITVECLGKQINGKRDVLKGTVVYRYTLDGVYVDGLPVNVGVYNVSVSYNAAAGDNYYSKTVDFNSVITITSVSPTILIKEKEFPFGTKIKRSDLYTLRGVQSDPIGPVVEKDGVYAVTVQYGIRRESAFGEIYYEWINWTADSDLSYNGPTAPGKYSIRITFNPLEGENNYKQKPETRLDCLTIANAVPTLALEPRVVIYNGNRFAANIATVYDSEGNIYEKYYGGAEEGDYYYGILNYEYRAANSSIWSNRAPLDAGTYDVRVTYNPNSQGDVFSTGELLVPAALVIKTLEITVIPVYGQGKNYDGKIVDADNIAFVYKYEAEGPDGSTYVYYVYSTVTDADGNRIDIDKFTYADADGNVYTIENGSGEAWRDYYEKAIELVSGSFMSASGKVNVDLASLDAIRGRHEYVDPVSGISYIIDLDCDIAYEADGISSYAYEIESGYYISTVDEAGRVTVIAIPRESVIPTDVSGMRGTYTRNVAGRNIVYRVDFEAMTAVNSGITYKIYTEVGRFISDVGGGNEIIRVDFNNVYALNASANTALYKTGDAVYILNFTDSSATKVYELVIEEIRVGYDGANGNEVYKNVTVADLTSAGFEDAYIGNCEVDGKVITVYLNKRIARVRLFYDVEVRDGGDYYLNDIYIDDLVKTPRYNVFIYDSYLTEQVFYVDLNTMTARLADELYSFGYTSEYAKGVLTSATGDKKIAVDPVNMEYVYYRGGKAQGVTTLYGKALNAIMPALIAGNSWTGGLSMLVQNAGNYEISGGIMGAGDNYSVKLTTDTINYVIGRIKLTVEFLPSEDNIYDGESKGIDYELIGILNNDDVRVTYNYIGNNRVVTEEGYRLEISVDSTNYYIDNATSPTYYILPAKMNAPTYDKLMTSVKYDGGRHSVPVTADPDAKIYYNGDLQTPYYIEPGRYLISVLVEKENYISERFEITLNITKSVFRVTPNQVAGTLRYGDKLPALTSNSTLGSIALDSDQILMPGLNLYRWTFTPYDVDSFYRYYESENGSSRITGTIELRVEKAKAEISINGNLNQSESKPTAITGSVNGALDFESSDDVIVYYEDSQGNRYSSRPTAAGRYTIHVAYKGDDLYEYTEQQFPLVITKETNLTWLYYVLGALGALGMLSTVFFIARRGKKFE